MADATQDPTQIPTQPPMTNDQQLLFKDMNRALVAMPPTFRVVVALIFAVFAWLIYRKHQRNGIPLFPAKQHGGAPIVAAVVTRKRLR